MNRDRRLHKISSLVLTIIKLFVNTGSLIAMLWYSALSTGTAVSIRREYNENVVFPGEYWERRLHILWVIHG